MMHLTPGIACQFFMEMIFNSLQTTRKRIQRNIVSPGQPQRHFGALPTRCL